MSNLFKNVNTGILGKRREAKELEAIMEAVIGDDFGTENIPFSVGEEEEIVDPDSLEDKDVSSVYADLDRFIDDEADPELEDMLDDDEYGELGDED